MAHDLQHILDGLCEGILVLDRTGSIERINPEACRLLGFSADSVTGRALGSLLGEDHPICQSTAKTLEQGKTVVQDDLLLQLPLKDDTLIDLTTSPLQGEDRSFTGAIVSVRDRSIHAQLAERVSKRERLEAFGDIASGIAHEVKNPLGGIRGAAELMGLRATEPKIRQTAELIVTEVDRIANLVDELMVLGRGDQLTLEPMNLHEVLDEVLELLAHDPLAEKIKIDLLYDPSIPDLLADRSRLKQVFLNVARNALQAMESTGGKLEIRTRIPVDQRLPMENGGSSPAALISFKDTGPGIPEDALAHLFTPFFTTRTEGTGLGLPVAGHWVTLHTGTLRIDNNPDQGATVNIALPLRRNDER
ncbi:MAG: PAS domain-containing protein [Deltaproteobacteria bacterium]|nr:PAS domain-containing protein [Deltaproteobacteria bacterium]